MEIEFDCGTVVKNIGNMKLAIQHHITVCENTDCIQDCKDNL